MGRAKQNRPKRERSSAPLPYRHPAGSEVTGKIRQRTVALADDHPLIVRALKDLIDARPEFKVVSVSYDGVSAIEAIRQNRPDVAVIDFNMPRLNGIDVLGEVANDGLPTRCILLAALMSTELALEAVRLGARGIVLKDTAPEKILECISRVLANEGWFSPEIAAAIESRGVGFGVGKPTRKHLTKREAEIEKLVRSGLSNKEIARRLSLAEGTVKVHLHHIYQKLEITSRTALLARALADEGRDPLRSRS